MQSLPCCCQGILSNHQRERTSCSVVAPGQLCDLQISKRQLLSLQLLENCHRLLVRTLNIHQLMQRGSIPGTPEPTGMTFVSIPTDTFNFSSSKNRTVLVRQIKQQTYNPNEHHCCFENETESSIYFISSHFIQTGLLDYQRILIKR